MDAPPTVNRPPCAPPVRFWALARFPCFRKWTVRPRPSEGVNGVADTKGGVPGPTPGGSTGVSRYVGV
jgi:hypothetical protein